MNLTARQMEILDFIKRFIAENGYSPTVREIAAGFNFKSPSSAQEHLKCLIQSGVITMDKQKSRTIELLVQNEYLKTSNTTVNIPVLENAYETVTKEFLEIPVFMLNKRNPKNVYAYKEGNSIYIISTNLSMKNKPSLVIKEGVLLIEEKPSDEVFGNIIGEFKSY